MINMKRDINTLSLLNEISELVYVSDPETYELLFVNQTGCQTLHLENYKHKKCYEVLQGKTSPCEFCTNDRLCDDNFYTWEFTNPSIGRHFLLKDKIIQWRGKTARMEIAFDITEQALNSIRIKRNIDFGTDVKTLIIRTIELAQADALMWYATLPSSKTGAKDSDGGWSHQEATVSISSEDRKAFRSQAMAIYRKWGESNGLGTFKIVNL